LFSTVFCESLKAQMVLEAKNKETGKTRSFKFGEKIDIMPEGYDYFIKAVIQEIKDTSITFYTPDESEKLLREYGLSQINAIKKATTLHRIGYFTGSVFLIPAVYTIASSGLLAGDTSKDAWITTGIGAGILGLAITPFLIKPKVYEAENWVFSAQ
jgi:hypothetical protein